MLIFNNSKLIVRDINNNIDNGFATFLIGILQSASNFHLLTGNYGQVLINMFGVENNDFSCEYIEKYRQVNLVLPTCPNVEDFINIVREILLILCKNDEVFIDRFLGSLFSI